MQKKGKEIGDTKDTRNEKLLVKLFSNAKSKTKVTRIRQKSN